MKFLFILLSLFIFTQVLAAPAEPIDVPFFSIYTPDKALNSRRAIRLGYQNFHARINTPDATRVDIQIAKLIQDGFGPFFEKLNQSETLPQKQKAELSPELNDEFAKLVLQLAQLLFKNQLRYTNPNFLEDQAAFEEAVVIVQEAIERGSF